MGLTESGSWILLAIAGLSLTGWHIGGLKWLGLRRELATGAHQARQIASLVRQNDLAAAHHAVRALPEGQRRIFVAWMGLLAAGRQCTPRQRQAIVRRETVRLRHGLSCLVAITMALPLLGLLGTVLGMMKTFAALGDRGRLSAAAMITNGISEALLSTQAGLVAAVPLLLLYGMLAARLRQSIARARLLLDE